MKVMLITIHLLVEALTRQEYIPNVSGGDIYRETVIDHYRNPRTNPDVSIHDSNPLCDNEIDIHLKVEASIIKDIKFEGRGCAISQASASMLTEVVINKPLVSVTNLSKGDKDFTDRKWSFSYSRKS